MLAEISAIVAGVNAATSAIKRVAETTNDISSISSFLSTLGGAEVELARAQNEGKLSEAEIQETMKEIKDLFTVSGNGQLYSEAMTAMAEARKAKQLELARKAAAKKQFWKEVKEYAAIFGVVVILLPMILALLINFLIKNT
jgi:hypothetical protein